jgi:hypothetical protein
MNNRRTNMFDVHTCTIGRPDLIGSIVPVMHCQLVQFTSDVVGCSSICVPEWFTTTM